MRSRVAGFLRDFSSCQNSVPRALLVALILAFPLPTWAGGDLIGGDDVIRIDPDFNFTFDFSDNPFINNIQQNFQISATAQSTAGVQTQLGAALSQAISASNRPSVLTPFAGVIWSDEEGMPVFDSFGSFVTNKASTIGKGNLGVGLSYQHTDFDQFKGDPIGKAVNSKVSSTVSSVGAQPGFGLQGRINVSTTSELRLSGVQFKVDVITLAVTYGLLDSLDIGALVPYIYLQTEGRATFKTTSTATASIEDLSGNVLSASAPDTRSATVKGNFDEDFTGFGDVVLFAKYQFISQDGIPGPGRVQGPVDAAIQAELKLPTGDEGEFLGTGKTDGALRLIVQREIVEDAVRLRGEVGFNRSGLGNDFNTFDYKVGLEWVATPELSVSAEVIGQDSRAFNLVMDGIIGAKYNLPTFSVFGGVRIPLNDNGLRFDYSPIIGIERTFESAFKKRDVASLPPRKDMPEFVPAAEIAVHEATPAAEPAGNFQADYSLEPSQAEPAAQIPTVAEASPVAESGSLPAATQSALPAQPADTDVDSGAAAGAPAGRLNPRLPAGRNYENDAIR